MSGPRPRWQWRLVDAGDNALERPGSPVFLARFDAEQWLGEHWRALARQGVSTVVLQHDGADAGVPLDLAAG